MSIIGCVVVLGRAQVFWSQHFTCMFGAVGSVHAWERIGAALTHLARYLLHLALFRYVDDYFGPDRFAAFCVRLFSLCFQSCQV